MNSHDTMHHAISDIGSMGMMENHMEHHMEHDHHDHIADDPSTPFCTGDMGMVMYMDGFQWTLKGGNSCINLYFPGWTLNSKTKFMLAMLGIVILAIVTEGISKYRHILSLRARQSSSTLSEVKRISYIQTGLHGIHALTGYILMLATMTFSIELFLSVIVGLVIGYLIFRGDEYNHVTTNPCCSFLEDEANERTNNDDEEIYDGAESSERRNHGECCENRAETETLIESSELAADNDGAERDVDV